ncbi:hypothetical protein HCU40_12635 [Pseudanabaena biceps]|nr:hypothetical protein [Pseudanabaena biceps]
MLPVTTDSPVGQSIPTTIYKFCNHLKSGMFCPSPPTFTDNHTPPKRSPFTDNPQFAGISDRLQRKG